MIYAEFGISPYAGRPLMSERMESRMPEADPEPISDVRRELMLAEYKSLRDESMRRMDHRITLLVSSLTVSGAILGLGVERTSGALLLLAPVISVLFGLLVLYHTKVIADIARYLKVYVEAPLDEHYTGSLGWYTRPGWRHNRFRAFSVFHLPMMLVVLVPAATGLALAWQYAGPAGVKISLAVLDGVLIVFYLVQYARRFSRPRVEAVTAEAQ